MKLHSVVLLLSSGLMVMADDQATLAQLPTRISDSHIKITLTNGTTLRSYLQNTKLANGGTLTVGIWSKRTVPCREVDSITYEPIERSMARGIIGTAIGFGVAIGGVVLMATTNLRSSPAVVFGSPVAGYYGAQRLVPRRPQTVSVICPP